MNQFDRDERALFLFSMLLRKEDFYKAVIWRAFARHAPVLLFFVVSAWTLDPLNSLIYAAVLWGVLSLLRQPLWNWDIQGRNIWGLIYTIDLVLVRWPIAILCIFIFWWRSPVIFGQFWPLMIGMLLFDIICTFVSEAVSYRRATRTIQELEQEYNQLSASERAEE